MSRPIISVEGLSKAYRIGVKEEAATTLTGATIWMLKAPFKNFRRLRQLDTYRSQGDSQNTHWALKDVSFDVSEGEVVGIIGRNGAGKSTLLKILSRITDPTSGRAVLRGRVSSLLEVGTGFHPELSGRENVYLNGTILGMTKREVERKFDEIVEFSGIEKFLDTPIKRYSSGMSVRLAFAVAAHLEPEILIIDEVLAVGDAEFQKKCLGKMKDVANAGRTVLFVSHNMLAVASLCNKGVVLSGGKVQGIGDAVEMVHKYEAARPRRSAGSWQPFLTEQVELTPLEYTSHLCSGDALQCALQLKLNGDVELTAITAVILDSSGVRLGVADLRPQLRAVAPIGSQCQLRITIDTQGWVEGIYYLSWFLETTRYTCNADTEWVTTVSPSRESLTNGAYPREYRGFVDLRGTVEVHLSQLQIDN